MLVIFTELTLSDCTNPGTGQGETSKFQPVIKMKQFIPACAVVVTIDCDGTLLVTLLIAVSEIWNKESSSTGVEALLLKVYLLRELLSTDTVTGGKLPTPIHCSIMYW